MIASPVVGQRYVIRLHGYKPTFSHAFREGEEVIAIRADSGDHKTWYYKSTERDTAAWVGLRDIEELDVGPSEREILEAFGIAPQSHCKTCTCHKD